MIKAKVPSEAGDHTVVVQVVTNLGSASDSKSFTIFEPFAFAHITDAHIGELWTETHLHDIIFELNNYYFQEPELKFALVTGDLVSWNWDYFFSILTDSMKSLHMDKNYVPGNHDRRTNPLSGNDNLDAYNKYIKSPDGKHMLNYWFDENGFMFIGLDSGHDYSEIEQFPFTPEGSGLEDFQYNRLLEPDMKNHPKKIIFMHHPAINEGNDELIYEFWDVIYGVPNICPEHGGNDECIAFNRCKFIEYCTNNNVQLVLTGHTHRDKVFDGQSINPITANSVRRPLFIQTAAAKDGWYRIIDVKSGIARPRSSRKAESHPNWRGGLACPANLHAYDSQGRHTGLNVSGGVELNIPDSFYLGRYNYTDPNETEIISLYNMSEDYRFEIIANLTEDEKNSPEIESFNFTVEQEREDMHTTISYLNVPLTENTTATLPINLTTTNYDMEIDYDGDGVIDETKSPDSIMIDYAPQAEIISPIDDSTYLYGEEIAFSGTGVDSEDGVLTNESLVWFSDVSGMIGIGNKFSEANLSVGRHNISLRVNDTLDQMNMSKVSIFIRSTQPDMFIDILKSNEIPGIEPHISLIETFADEPCDLIVYIRNTGYGMLNNVQILTNVSVAKDIGNINEGEERLVTVQFTPAMPGIFGLNATVNSDEIEKKATRALLVKKFNFVVSIPKTEYNQSEPVPVNISVTSEVPNIRFIDLKIEINISNPIYNQIFDIPLLSLAPFVTKNITSVWDTTGVNNGTYTIVTSLMMADQEVMSEAKHICLGKILLTDLPNVELVSADPAVSRIDVSAMALSDIDTTDMPSDFLPEIAYLINATGSGSFTLRFTDIAGAYKIKVYKIDPESTPPNQWVEWSSITTGDTVTFTMSVGDPPMVFGSVKPIHPPTPPTDVPSMTSVGTAILIGSLSLLAVSRIRRRFN